MLFPHRKVEIIGRNAYFCGIFVANKFCQEKQQTETLKV